MRLVGSALGRLYGLPKIHKIRVPLRPVFYALNTFNYKLAKYFVPIISPLTSNPFTVKDYFTFAWISFIPDADKFTMATCSFDVVSLFTNNIIPLEDTINLILDQLFSDPNKKELMA